ncbi:MAG: 50S ribosomal protein L35 [Planctomycetota bacterium]
MNLRIISVRALRLTEGVGTIVSSPMLGETFRNLPMHGRKPNKGLLKRIRFTGTGRVKFHRAFTRKQRSHKSGKLLRSYRVPAYFKSCEMRRVGRMLFRSVRAGAANV